MKKLNIIYLITSIVFLLSFLAAPWRELPNDWRKIQKDHRSIIKSKGLDTTTPRGIQQIWQRDMDRIDRCTTCHQGVQNPELKEAANPHRFHPDMVHDVAEFGCTICHGGQGLATRIVDAHQSGEAWDEPVLPLKYAEAFCGRCHIGETLVKTPILNQGRKLVKDLKCFACHGQPTPLTRFTPQLNGLALKIQNGQWLVRWLSDPDQVRAGSRMPNFHLSEDEISGLVDLLMTWDTFPTGVELPSLPFSLRRRLGDNGLITTGKTLFRDSPCTSCHSLNGDGPKTAVDLGGVGSKATATWIYQFITDPQSLHPGVDMPRFGFTESQLQAITAYCVSDLIDWEADAYDGGGEEKNQVELGLETIQKYNCAGCHAATGIESAFNVGPEHVHFGSKKPYQIWFEEVDISHTLHDYIDAKLQNPRQFGETTRMPRFHLENDDRQALVTYLLSQKDEDLPFHLVRREVPPLDPPVHGEMGRIADTYSCFKCHGMDGYGESVGPDLSILGSRIQQRWLRDFLDEPVSRRPLIDERMPNLRLTSRDIQTIVEYTFSVLLDDAVTVPTDWQPDQNAQRRGQTAYENYNCRNCHILNGDGEFIGPPLDEAGERLQPGWIAHWLLNPTKYIPDTIEPETGMSLNEALDIAAYLIFQ